jgi:antagonist of KipI
MVPGAIQLPPDGDPIALLPDHQTVGGYPVVAVVSQADLPRLGQLRPGDQVRFAPTTLEDARAALLEQLAALDAARVALRDAAQWDDLAHHAGS